MIQLVNVTKIYNNDGVLTTGLHNISLEFSKNEIVAIVGESGSGKSTLLNVLTKMDTFDEGEYYYKGNETSYFNIDDMDHFRKNKVGFIFQNYNIIDSYTVLENVMLPFILRGFSEKEAKEQALELITKVGLKGRANNRGTQLSGGEKQRVVIARALAGDCEILACDEPTGNLDSQTSKEIVELLKEVAKDKLVLIVTHNYELFQDIVTRKITIHDGEVLEDLQTIETQKEENENLNLDYQPVDKKAKLRVAKNNLFSTPKKTILTSLILLCVTIFTLFLYQSIYFSYTNESYANPFSYKGEDKIIVYHISKEELDLSFIEKISSKYNVNEFYAARNFLHSNDYLAQMENLIGYEKYPSHLQLDGGRMPAKEEEVILLLPKNSASEKEILDQSLNFSGQTFTIVGYQYRTDVHRFLFTNCDKFERLLLGERLAEQTLTFSYQGMESSLYISYSPDIKESYLLLPEEFQPFEQQIQFPTYFYGDYNFHMDFSTFPKQYLHDIAMPTIFIGDDFIETVQSHPYEVSLYVENVPSAVQKLEQHGYSTIVVKTYSNETAFRHFIDNFSSKVTMFFSSIAILILYFISFIILARVYASKNKEYTILRTLGIAKKDMRDIVLFEVMSMTTCITVGTYLLALIIRLFTTEGIFEVFTTISPFASILYFIIMMLFGYFTARGFNRKLFKFSVNKTFKRKEARHD